MKKAKKYLVILVTLLLTFTIMPENVKASGASGNMKLSSTAVSLAVGAKKSVKLMNTPGGDKVTWKSSNTSVAKVESIGRVTSRITGKKAGVATITAKFDGKTYKCRVTVKGAELSDDTKKLTVGMQTETIKLEGTYGVKKAVWTSSNDSVVSVKSIGRVTARLTAKKAGTATITAKFGGKTYKCKVKVQKPALSVKSLKLTEGNKKTLKLDYVFGKNNVAWKSSNAAVASVKRAGRVTAQLTAKSAGTATITARVYGKTYSFKVTVKEKLLAPKLNKEDVKIIVGKKTNLQLTGTTGREKVTWTSSNASVASVDSQSRTVGKITAKKSGKVVITAKWGGKSYKCTVRVLQLEISDLNIRLTPGLSYDIWMDFVLERPDRGIIDSKWTKATAQEFELLKTTENVIWKSSNPAVVSVSKKNSDTATLTAKATGTATITATVNGKDYKCKVNVITAYPEPRETYLGEQLTEKENDALELLFSYAQVTKYPGAGYDYRAYTTNVIRNQPIRKLTRIGRLIAPTASYRFYRSTIPYFDKIADEGYFDCGRTCAASGTSATGYIVR